MYLNTSVQACKDSLVQHKLFMFVLNNLLSVVHFIFCSHVVIVLQCVCFVLLKGVLRTAA